MKVTHLESWLNNRYTNRFSKDFRLPDQVKLSFQGSFHPGIQLELDGVWPGSFRKDWLRRGECFSACFAHSSSYCKQHLYYPLLYSTNPIMIVQQNRDASRRCSRWTRRPCRSCAPIPFRAPGASLFGRKGLGLGSSKGGMSRRYTYHPYRICRCLARPAWKQSMVLPVPLGRRPSSASALWVDEWSQGRKRHVPTSNSPGATMAC